MKVDLTDREVRFLLHHVQDALDQERRCGGEDTHWMEFLEAMEKKLLPKPGKNKKREGDDEVQS